MAAPQDAILTKRMSEALTGARHLARCANRAVRIAMVAVMPAQAGIQYAVKARPIRNGAEYWSTRLRG
jgi:hypothetical protein